MMAQLGNSPSESLINVNQNNTAVVDVTYPDPSNSDDMHAMERRMRARRNWAKIKPREVVRVARGGQPRVSQITRSSLSLGRADTTLSGDEMGSAATMLDGDGVLLAQDDEEELEEKPVVADDLYIRAIIPVLPMPLAALCFSLNVVLPGFGTILSGLSVVCCSRPRSTGKPPGGNGTIVCVNIFVGLSQLFTVTFMLVGFFWSVVWGIYMIILSVEAKREAKAAADAKLKAMALTAFNPEIMPWTLRAN